MQVWQLVSLAGLVGQALAFNLFFAKIQNAFSALVTPIAPPPAGTMVVLDVALGLLLVNALFQHVLGATETTAPNGQVVINNILLFLAAATFGAWAITFVMGPELVSYALLAVSVILSGVVFVKTSLVHVTEHPRKLSSTSLGCRQLLHSLFVLAPLGVYFASSVEALGLLIGDTLATRGLLTDLGGAILESCVATVIYVLCLFAMEPLGMLTACLFLAGKAAAATSGPESASEFTLALLVALSLGSAVLFIVGMLWAVQKQRAARSGRAWIHHGSRYLSPEDVKLTRARNSALETKDASKGEQPEAPGGQLVPSASSPLNPIAFGSKTRVQEPCDSMVSRQTPK